MIVSQSRRANILQKKKHVLFRHGSEQTSRGTKTSTFKIMPLSRLENTWGAQCMAATSKEPESPDMILDWRANIAKKKTVPCPLHGSGKTSRGTKTELSSIDGSLETRKSLKSLSMAATSKPSQSTCHGRESTCKHTRKLNSSCVWLMDLGRLLQYQNSKLGFSCFRRVRGNTTKGIDHGCNLKWCTRCVMIGDYRLNSIPKMPVTKLHDWKSRSLLESVRYHMLKMQIRNTTHLQTMSVE